MLSCISHMTILSVITRVLNVQRFKRVTSSCPIFDCSSQFVDRPENVKCTNSFLTSLQLIPVSSYLKWRSSKQGMDFLFVCSEYLSTHFHVVRPYKSFRLNSLTICKFSVAPEEIRDLNISRYWKTTFSFGYHARWMHPDFWEPYFAFFQPFWCRPRTHL